MLKYLLQLREVYVFIDSLSIDDDPTTSTLSSIVVAPSAPGAIYTPLTSHFTHLPI
jgi:hypothetical protein